MELTHRDALGALAGAGRVGGDGSAVFARRVTDDGDDTDVDGSVLETLVATRAERIRFALVNELLYALYASSTGSERVWLENPSGDSGGTERSQRGPQG